MRSLPALVVSVCAHARPRSGVKICSRITNTQVYGLCWLCVLKRRSTPPLTLVHGGCGSAEDDIVSQCNIINHIYGWSCLILGNYLCWFILCCSGFCYACAPMRRVHRQILGKSLAVDRFLVSRGNTTSTAKTTLTATMPTAAAAPTTSPPPTTRAAAR